MFEKRRRNVDRLLHRNRCRLLAGRRGVLGLDIALLHLATCVACRISNDRKQDRAAETLPPVGVDITIDAGSAECVCGGRREGDDYPCGRFCTVPQNEQPLLAPLQATTILAHDLCALSISTTRPLSERTSRLMTQLVKPG